MVACDFDHGRRVPKNAEASVQRGERRRLLHGLLVTIKDLMATEGLRKAGAIIAGKTNAPKFGAGSNTVNRVYGATVNPFEAALEALA